MDRQKFTKTAPGRLVPIVQPRKDWAFVPHPLPLDWEFPVELWPLLAEAKERLGTLNGIGQTLQNPKLLLRPLQSREAITSSSIEGTYVTPEQLLFYELDPQKPRLPSDEEASQREVHNYARALQRGFDLLDELPFCLRIIRAVAPRTWYGNDLV